MALEPEKIYQGKLNALAISPAPNEKLYGLNDKLWQIDITTGEKKLIADLNGFNILGADFSPKGILYGVSEKNELVIIDTSSGNVTVKSKLSTDIGTIGSITFISSSDSTTIFGSGSGGPQGDILFLINTENGSISNIEHLAAGRAPQGMGFALDYNLCEYSGEPRKEQIDFSAYQCGGYGNPLKGRLLVVWGDFGPLETLEADSGEKLELFCDGRAFILYYYPRPNAWGGTPTPERYKVGLCKYSEGCNSVYFFHSGDSNVNYKPDCFIKTRWITRDYGDNDDPTENPKVLDWTEFDFQVSTMSLLKGGFLTKNNYDYDYLYYPPSCNKSGEKGGIIKTTPDPDPQVGPETEAYFEGVLAHLLTIPQAPMTCSPFKACDLNKDGYCGDEDLTYFLLAYGYCRDSNSYNPEADINGDGCVDYVDQVSLFNRQPICDVNGPYAVDRQGISTEIKLDGTKSSDPDGDNVSYRWTTTCPMGYFENSSGPVPTLSLDTSAECSVKCDVMLTVNDHIAAPVTCNATVSVSDTAPPIVNFIVPQDNTALQDGINFNAQATDISGIDKVFFYVREPDGGEGTPIGYEDLEASYTSATDVWEYPFDTTVLQDGYYVILAKAIDSCGNEGWSAVVPFSIRNWAVIELLPSTPNNKAGRTMPVKFSLRIAASVDPAMPFVYNEDLEIRIYDARNPGTILQRSVFGDGSKNYRIDLSGQKYITNFQTGKTPATYVVEIWRPSNNFMVGSFTFKTVK
jgi:hypothetical protein